VTHNQDWVLAQWRKDASKDDPPFYATMGKFGRIWCWLNPQNNTGWYWPVIEGGVIKELHSMAFNDCDSLIKYLSPKQRRKVEAAIATHK
jgi:hypothetical protein